MKLLIEEQQPMNSVISLKLGAGETIRNPQLIGAFLAIADPWPTAVGIKTFLLIHHLEFLSFSTSVDSADPRPLQGGEGLQAVVGHPRGLPPQLARPPR